MSARILLCPGSICSKCQHCGAKGFVKRREGVVEWIEPCPSCQGLRVVKRPCQHNQMDPHDYLSQEQVGR